ncbi:MAG TPA: hypothetical protein VL284_03780 [Thermoanaerobaculia bacterium]|nr:hypothetical protein [Thermoanaerobaculia bacterium]
MRFRPRDHERFIGGYDPEHEMPDPERDPRDRWQSDAYRRNARDTRFMYRWNPDRIEEQRGWDRGRGRDIENEIRPRDRYEAAYRAGYEAGYDRGYEHGYTGYNDRRRYDWDRDWAEREWRDRY